MSIETARQEREDALGDARTAFKDATAQANQRFADAIREEIAKPDETMGTVATKARLSRQVLHDILRRHPAHN